MKISWQTIGQMPEENLKEMQNEKVRFLMRTLVPMHPFYRKLYEEKGIDYRKINSADDLQKFLEETNGISFSKKKIFMGTADKDSEESGYAFHIKKR